MKITNLVKRSTQAGELNIINTTTVEIKLPELDDMKIMIINFHVDDAQIIHNKNNTRDNILSKNIIH